MPGPAPTYRPTLTPEGVAACERLLRRPTAPQAQVARAKLALLLHARPDRDTAAVARLLGRHVNWVFRWRRAWATAGFRLTDKPGRGRKPALSPLAVATVRALACALPARRDRPLSRSSTADFVRSSEAQPQAPATSASTIWRILDRDALKPWRHRSWITPRDPHFAAQAGRVLDLYAVRWEGQPLDPADGVVSADEKTSIQARRRCAPTAPPRRGAPMPVEHEYERGGALAYLAAWDVRRGGAVGRCETTTGSAPFDRLVAQVLAQEPDRSAPRVFWVVDNGSSHRGAPAVRRLQGRYPNLILVHLPTHASWRNQIALFFSIVQRKVLTPNDFPDLTAVEQRLLAFEALYNDTAVPFNWRFTRAALADRLAALPDLPPPRATAPPPLPPTVTATSRAA